MNRKFVYYIIFAVSFLLFSIVQDYIRPNYDGANEIIIYLLGVAPNSCHGNWIACSVICGDSRSIQTNSSLFKNRLYWSVVISILGLIATVYYNFYMEEVSSIGMIFYGL